MFKVNNKNVRAYCFEQVNVRREVSNERSVRGRKRYLA